MSYKYEDFLNDYSEDEDYLGREDELAFVYTLDSAYAGNTEYMRVLGDIYSSSGHGVKTDYGKAIFWYGKGADSGDVCSALRLADLYYGEKNGVPRDYEKAFALYKVAAKGDVPKAMARLGIMCLYGMGCKKVFARARALLEKAANAGEREACYEYAHILKEEGADNWFDYLEKSARASYGKACWEIIQTRADELTDGQFLMYLTGAATDCSPDFDPIEAQLTAAECFMHGKRLKKDENAAKSYLKYAAERGSEEAKKALKNYFNIDFK